MPFLSTLLPGARELRTPLSAGLIWLAFAALIFIPHKQKLFTDLSAVATIQSSLSPWKNLLTAGLVIGISYLFGNVAVSAISPLMNIMGRRIRVPFQKIADRSLKNTNQDGRREIKYRRPKFIFTASRKFCSWAQPITQATRSAVFDYIRTTLTKGTSMPGSAIFAYPSEMMLGRLKYCASQLSESAATQYQEYDRYRSEADFRVAVVPPLFCLSFVVPIHGRGWVIAAGAIIGAVLLCQAVSQTKAANEVLANSIYSGHISIPGVQALADHLAILDPKPENTGSWMAEIGRSLFFLGEFMEAEEALWSFAEAEANEIDEALEYLNYHEPKLARLLERKLDLEAQGNEERANG